MTNKDDNAELKDPSGFKTAIELAFKGEISHGAASFFNRLRRWAGKYATKTQKTQEYLAERLGVSTKAIRDWTRQLEKAGMIKTQRAGVRFGLWFYFLPDYSQQWTELCREHPDNVAPETPKDAPAVKPEPAKAIPVIKPEVRIQPSKNPIDDKARNLIARFGLRHGGKKEPTLFDVEMSKSNIVHVHGHEVFNRMMLQLTE